MSAFRGRFLCALLASVAAALNACGDDGFADVDAGPPVPAPLGQLRPQAVGLACGVVGSLLCDGSEDCPAGEICCGTWRGGFEAAACMPASGCFMQGGQAEAPRERRFELCHPGERCARAYERCGESVYLPEGLFRCFSGPGTSGVEDPERDGGTHEGLDAGPREAEAPGPDGVRCGASRCAAGFQCCLRPPRAPYCTPSAGTCSCGADGGVPGVEDAGTGDAGPSADAGLDAGGGAPDAGAGAGGAGGAQDAGGGAGGTGGAPDAGGGAGGAGGAPDAGGGAGGAGGAQDAGA